MGGMREGEEEHLQASGGEVEGKNHFEDLGVVGML